MASLVLGRWDSRGRSGGSFDRPAEASAGFCEHWPQYQHGQVQWSPEGILTVESPVPVKDRSSKKIVLGTPFGTAETVRLFLDEVRSRHHHLLQRLSLFPDPQVAVLLL